MDAETSRSHLFDRAAGDRTVRIGTVTPRSSPPSPVLLLPPILFIAIAIASCASRLSEPNDIAPVTKRFMISVAGSTSDRSIGLRFNSIKSRRNIGDGFSLTSRVYSLNFFVTAQPRGQLQRRDRLRIPRMPLAVLTIGVIAEILQRRILVVRSPKPCA